MFTELGYKNLRAMPWPPGLKCGLAQADHGGLGVSLEKHKKFHIRI
jgi:hypothetical protein